KGQQQLLRYAQDSLRSARNDKYATLSSRGEAEGPALLGGAKLDALPGNDRRRPHPRAGNRDHSQHFRQRERLRGEQLERLARDVCEQAIDPIGPRITL